MVNKLIAQFMELSRDIETAIEKDDTDMVYSLDNDLQACWAAIISYIPASPKEMMILVEFMLDCLTSDQDQKESNLQSRSKILELFNEVSKYH